MRYIQVSPYGVNTAKKRVTRDFRNIMKRHYFTGEQRPFCLNKENKTSVFQHHRFVVKSG